MTETSQSDLILARLQESPGEWVSMPELAAVGESMNVHTRIDELRHKGGHHIENYQEKQTGTRRRKSYYRLILPEPVSTVGHSAH